MSVEEYDKSERSEKSAWANEAIVSANDVDSQAGCSQVGGEVDEEVLKRGLRKVDWRLLPPLGILYLFSYMDRGSLSNASIFGIKKSLDITTSQYNMIATVFYFTYGPLEVPAQILMTNVKPKYWIAAVWIVLSVGFTWGVVVTMSGLVRNYGGALAARLALGVAEASFMPSAIYLVGSWYPRASLQTRISSFYVVGVFSGAFSGLLAYAINYMNGVGGYESWRWIFLIEGMATVVLSSLILIFLPNSPETSNFLTQAEKDAIIANRAAEGDGGRNHFEMKYLRDILTDWTVWGTTWIASTVDIVGFGFIYTMPTILVQLGYKAENAQLMTVPIYASACVCVLVSSIISDRIKKRFPVILLGMTVTLIGLVLLYCLPKTSLARVRYFGCVILLCGVYVCFPACLAWNSNNAGARGRRNMAMAFQLAFSNTITAAGTNSYLSKEAPYYHTGFGLSIALTASTILVTIALAWHLNRKNKVLDREAEEAIARGEPPNTFRYML